MQRLGWISLDQYRPAQAGMDVGRLVSELTNNIFGFYG
jgi:hypothetical protein